MGDSADNAAINELQLWLECARNLMCYYVLYESGGSELVLVLTQSVGRPLLRVAVQADVQAGAAVGPAGSQAFRPGSGRPELEKVPLIGSSLSLQVSALDTALSACSPLLATRL